MKTYLTLILAIGSMAINSVLAQCPTTSIILNTQSQIDSFPVNYPNCTQLIRSLLIGGSFNDANGDIVNLDSLSQIVSVENNLVIQYTDNLASIEGLQNITSAPYLQIIENQSLTTLSGLQSLNSTTNININDNSNLLNLNVLQNFDSISTLSITDNISLTNLNDLQNLNDIHSLWISGNNNLTNLNGLQNLNAIYSLSIRNNNNLTNLDGLQNLNDVDRLSIEDNDNLTNLNGLESIDSIKINLSIENNDNLSNIAAVENIGLSTNIAINIIGNPVLSTCDLQNICNHIGNNGFTIISGNASGCESGLEVAQLCGVSLPCPIGTVNLLSQEDVDNFPILYPDCTELIYTLNIGEFGNSTDINDLSPLSQITTVRSLSIRGNPDLTNLIGLDNLESVGGAVKISSNFSLSNLSLNSLTFTGHDMYISGNTALTNLNGLDNLTSVGGHLIILSHPNLIDLSGLESLTHVATLIWINSNTVLESLTGIENIPSDQINTLQIENNPNLSVCGLENICHFIAEGGPTFLDNNLEGCNTANEILQSCDPSIWDYAIQGNIFMDTNADCLKDTTEVDLNGWLVKVEGEQNTRYGYTFQNGNYIVPVDTGTFVVTPIPPNFLWEDICFENDVAVLTPLITRDTLNFGASTSTFCPLLEVDITTPNLRRCSNNQYYVRYCNSGTLIAEDAYVEVQLDPFFTYQNSSITAIDLGENLYFFELGDIDVGECGDFQIEVYVDCDSTVIGQTHCVEAHIFPDSICSPINPVWDESSIMVNAECLGDSIEFTIENVGGGDMSDSLEYMVIEEDLIWHRANFQLDSGDNIKFSKPANGEYHRIETQQSPGHPGNSMPSVFIEGCGADGNGDFSLGFVNYYVLDEGNAFVSIDCQENIGAYDPNDKQAFPVGYSDQHYITDSTNLEYLIRFQNTGTDTAFNIVIRDTISPHLNIETLRPGVASHSYRYDIEGANVAVFHFENIMLPDSNVNEATSHGFIKFDIEQQADNPIGTLIENNAGIYFDFNEPIITNTVFHTVGEDFIGIITSIITPPEVAEAGILVNVFPNPFDEYTRFEVQGEVVKELYLRVYDMMGREVLQQKAQHQQHITMKRNNLSPGVYVFRLIDEKQQLATGKLVIK